MRDYASARALRATLLGLAGFAIAQAASADTVIDGGVTGNLPTCHSMLKNCIAFAQRAEMAAGPGGQVDSNITRSACYDMARSAQSSGAWPANPPLGFAMSCVADGARHVRHHHFRDANGQIGTPIPDPAVTPLVTAPTDPTTAAAPSSN